MDCSFYYIKARNMADDKKPHEKPDSSETTTEATTAAKSWFGFLNSQAAKHWLAILLVATLVFHGIGLIYYKISSSRSAMEYSPEIALGNFRFTVDKSAGGPIAGADFSLYVTAIDGLDRFARSRLASHQFRVQEEVEKLCTGP